MSPARRRSPVRRWLLAFGVLVVVGAGAGLAVAAQARTGTTPAAADATSFPTSSPTGTTTTTTGTTTTTQHPAPTGTEPVPTDPPTSVATDPPSEAAGERAAVAVSYAGWDAGSASVEVDAYVGGRVEDGGTCTLTLTQDGDARAVDAPASADASSTICAPLHIPGDGLASGVWTATVGYSSASGSGTSDPVQVTVP